MNILIDHAGFINKGAELMLYATRDSASRLFPDAKFVIQEEIAAIPKDKIVKKRFHILSHPKDKRRFIPDKYTHYAHFIRPRNIDLVLDAGGFQFSDQWIEAYTEESNEMLRQYYSTLKSGGAKIVFLPQALGPFTLPLAIERIKDAYAVADLFYAREQTSYNHLCELLGTQEKIRLCPDFTNIYKPSVPMADLLPFKAYIGIIPNQKMVTHTPTNVSKSYLTFMVDLCKKLMGKGHPIVLINHEGKGDQEIMRTIKDELPKEVIYLNNLNAAEIKAVIGRLKAVVSSRFHGAASGLAQRVLTFCTGWSHKYQELLKDYGVESNFLQVNDLHGSYQKIVQAMESKDKERFHPDRLAVSSQEQQVRQMWDEISQLPL
ncbi:polysaccharide pyruvyl transferase family protein [Olivibacter sitiensis]|uniref:polysaccharide pyruvyl transferase family protein n=1 Tax=Olivibacter sitiensis TaxID=376470 RepID=UPI0003FC5589|nr:polysaccharide pyruvyl transferase family protein [Olivibacter sitiensis]